MDPHGSVAPRIELAPDEVKELVRVVALGSVDDGKSTLIGRLLYETGALYEDQVAAVKRASRLGGEIDFSLFTDGLKAEREQGITIDVAYRYFVTARRKFILADAPGHAQYTRNMATGASTADAGVVLLDARLGVLPQSRRHLAIAALLGIRRLAVAVNKMDLVGFERAVFERIADEVRDFAARLGFTELRFIPLSARDGDNVALRSPRTPWHRGGTLLEFLETVEVARERALGPLRFPVQSVLRAKDYRGYAGQIASGSVAVGDEVVVLPSGARTRVRAIDTFEGGRRDAGAPLSVALRLADAVDVARGDLIAAPQSPPSVRTRFEATAVWLSERPLDPGRAYLLKHTTRLVPARVEAVRWRLDPETLAQLEAERLELNDVGRIAIRCARAIACDSYRDNRVTGAFILVDALSNDTVAGGAIVLDEAGRDQTSELSGEIRAVGAEERRARLGHGAAVVLVERESERAALALAGELEQALFGNGCATVVVRSAEAALACAGAGLVAVCAAAGPELSRARLRAELRASGVPLVELRAGDDARDPVQAALAELSSLGALPRRPPE
jgi:bifunctional enzyme CysN/CysC/sulfate adenylyltransferase subunit 1